MPDTTAAALTRSLLAVDALVEIAVASPLLAGRPRRLHAAAPLPLRLAGAGLLPFAALLAAGATRPVPPRVPVLALAAVNAATGAVIAGWTARRRAALGPADRGFAHAVALALGALAAAEAPAARRLPAG
jgi:hypothetical protein